jgi:ADP-L-glycero-D-manno-heptose 6-epimerase
MASVAHHHYHQIQQDGVVRLFEGCHGYGDGEQVRDFVYVDDAVNVNLWMLDHPEVSGVFNCGTGKAEPFNQIASAVVAYFGKGQTRYVPFPDHLQAAYQSFTQADIDGLRRCGYSKAFVDVEQGVQQYMSWLTEQNKLA